MYYFNQASFQIDYNFTKNTFIYLTETQKIGSIRRFIINLITSNSKWTKLKLLQEIWEEALQNGKIKKKERSWWRTNVKNGGWCKEAIVRT